MTCPERYDIRITDASGEAHGFVCDWGRGGAGLTIEKAANLESTRLASKGEYGVKDVNDYVRIIQTDWSQGCGQDTYDREADSESAFKNSWSIDTSKVGTLRIGKEIDHYAETGMSGPIFAHGGNESYGPYLWAAEEDAGTAVNRIQYSTDGATWSSIATAGPGGTPTDFAGDGQRQYCAGGGQAYSWTTAAGGVTAVSAETGITHVASAAGVLYGAKGSESANAQVGYFSAVSGATWTALTPTASEAINAYGSTFGLVTLGTYVYWGVTNGMQTKVYKVRRGDGSSIADTLEEVATFPSGFVGSCLYSYIDTVYVGGAYGTSENGLGAIYAIVDDTPALLTNVGSTQEADNRVLAMTGWERNLYFVSNSAIWRWDLVNGGYSHWAGPLDSTAVMNYTDITWTGTWTCNVIPGAGTEPDATVTTSGTTSAASDGTALTITLSTASDSRKYTATEAVSAIDDTVGTTLEVDVPSSAITGTFGEAFLKFGIDGSAKKAHVAVSEYKATGSLGTTVYRYKCELYSGSTWLSQATCTDAAHTFRLTLKNGQAEFYIDNAKCMSNPATATNSTEAIWMSGVTDATSGSVTVNEVRWTDDGAYDSEHANQTSVTGIGLAAMDGRLYAACSGVGCAKVWRSELRTANTGETVVPYLTSSRSAANMPTVDKYFHGLVVTLENIIPSTSDVTAQFVIDGTATDAVAYDTDLSTDTELFFPIGLTGKNIYYTLYLETTDTGTGPVVAEAAVLCRPLPKTTKLYSYFLRLWERVQGPNGQEWNENPSTCVNFLEENANTTVTVEHAHGEYTGTIESMEFAEAPPSGQSQHRQGLYRINVRRLS